VSAHGRWPRGKGDGAPGCGGEQAVGLEQLHRLEHGVLADRCAAGQFDDARGFDGSALHPDRIEIPDRFFNRRGASFPHAFTN